MKYDYNTFKQLFDSHIQYSYEGRHACYLDTGDIGEDGLYQECAIFYKLYIYSNGTLNYKGNVQTYNPKLWPKVKALVKMLKETKAEKILFQSNKEVYE